MNEFISTFIFFFAVIDPIGTVPVFISATQRYEEHIKRKIALKATMASAIILVFFVAAGELILKAIDIPLSAFQIAGGLVLFIFALTMIFGESKPEEEMKAVGDFNEVAIFPLATPSIASPGAMLASVLLTENDTHSFWEQAETTLVIFSVLAIVLLLMLAAGRVHRFIGNSGAGIISRIMGLILASAAVSSVLAGIKEYFAL